MNYLMYSIVVAVAGMIKAHAGSGLSGTWCETAFRQTPRLFGGVAIRKRLGTDLKVQVKVNRRL